MAGIVYEPRAEVKKDYGIMNITKAVNQRLINAQELSNMLGISVNTAYSWVSQRKIPLVKCGRLTKFDVQKIEEWIKENSVEEKEFR